ncbi:transporter substrate-binding domain-containing protein (plasmid) [Rhizobium sp. CB3060]|uniref:transporter substrate-binding domain-containing protein n=1 Tax=Rhizobium sp. CB3060 TaxID=3138255 RepID=UPI0021A3DF63|nr:transporter substrate-binding domain-containing protein [Rhizobium tropici]UWU25519.1 transporter substrate-binding domain-containing protein [Rhizobium tropici]
MMKRTIGITKATTLALAITLLNSYVAAADDGRTVTIALEGAYEPWNLTRSDGTLDGFEPELAKYLCEKAKLSCKLIANDWDGMFTGLQAGKFDVIMDGVNITPERKKQVAFSIPYANTPAAFVVNKTGSLNELPDLKTVLKLDDAAKGDSDAEAVISRLRKALTGKTIGVQISTVYSDFIHKKFGDVADIREYKTPPEHDLDLTAGRIDVAFDDATYFGSALAKPDNADLAFSGPEVGGAIWGGGQALAFRTDDADLKTKFDGAIKAALADGTVKTLAQKWFKRDVSP